MTWDADPYNYAKALLAAQRAPVNPYDTLMGLPLPPGFALPPPTALWFWDETAQLMLAAQHILLACAQQAKAA